MTENKRFIVIDAPYENGEPFLYKKMLDKTTKKEYDNTLKGIDDMCDLANNLHKENEQLKKELKDYHNAFDCSQCKYQNYNWFDDGDEFEVCDKGNDEAQMDNHSCKDWEEL